MLTILICVLIIGLVATMWRVHVLREEIHDLYIKDTILDDTTTSVNLWSKTKAKKK